MLVHQGTEKVSEGRATGYKKGFRLTFLSVVNMANWESVFTVKRNKISIHQTSAGANSRTLQLVMKLKLKINIASNMPASSCSCVTRDSSWPFSRFAFSHSSLADTASLLRVWQSCASVWTSLRSDSTILSMSDTLWRRDVWDSSRLARSSFSLISSSLSWTYY